MTDLVKLNPKEYGLEENSAKQVEKAFLSLIGRMTELEENYNSIVGKDITPSLTKEAKSLRLKYRDIRTSVDATHKKEKAFYLSGGRFIDGWKNAATFAIGEKETKLKNIEEYFDNLEKDRLEKLRKERTEMLQSISDEFEIVIPSKIELMDENVFTSFVDGEKSRIEKLIKEREQAERERAERIEKERIYNERYKVLARYSDFIDLDELTPESTREEADALKNKAEKLYAGHQEKQKKIAEQLEKERKAKEELQKQEAQKAKADKESRVKFAMDEIRPILSKYKLSLKDLM